MKPEIYVVNAYKWGNRENHSYTVGVFTKKAQAIKCADDHRDYRGGKYSCVVEKTDLNGFSNDMENYTEEVYTAKSLLD